MSGTSFDVKAATEAWLAKVPADKRARSDDHPSGRSRIEMAMRYKAENPGAN